ncbi:MAG: hemerythrin family protein [Alphaproteobacteria bacterium]|nr:hemerythrin family protein [Alphaproteobacteria bacterium]
MHHGDDSIDLPILGYAEIDDDHQLIWRVWQQVLGVADDGVAGALRRVVEVLAQHFMAEEALMKATGFPGADCHRAEHDRVLAVLERVIQATVAGNGPLGRYVLVREVPTWFARHVTGMDRLTVLWLRGRATATDHTLTAAA